MFLAQKTGPRPSAGEMHFIFHFRSTKQMMLLKWRDTLHSMFPDNQAHQMVKHNQSSAAAQISDSGRDAPAGQ